MNRAGYVLGYGLAKCVIFVFVLLGHKTVSRLLVYITELGIADRRALNEISGLNQLQAVHSKLQYKF